MTPKSIFVGVLIISFIATAANPLSVPTAKADNDGPEPAALFSNNAKVNSGGVPFSWQVEPTLVVGDSGLIHVGWKEANSDTGGGMRVSYSNSNDGGQTWSPNILMATANPSTRASDPWLIKDRQGRVHYTRLEFNSAGTLSGITTSNTTDGMTWGNANYLNDMPNFADKETVAVDPNGVLYLAYNSNTVQNNMVIRKSYDGGATWTSRVPIPDVQGQVIGAYVALDNFGRVFVAWTDFATGNVLIDVSNDGGTTWGTDVRVNDVSGTVLDPLAAPWNITLPVVVIDSSNNIYVAWTDYRTANSYGDIFVARSRTNGASWDPAVRVNDYTGPAGQRMVDMTIDDGGVLHCAWYDHRLGGYDVYYSNSTDRGQTWSPNIRVTTATTPRAYPRPGDYITIRTNPLDQNVYVVWTDGRGIDYDIYFASMNEPVATQVIDTNPSGLQIIIDSIIYIAPQVRNWAVGEVHEIGTFPMFNISPGSRFIFSDWSDGGLIMHQVTIAGSETFTAKFVLQYYFDVTSMYGMTNGSGWFNSGAMVIGCVDPAIVYLSSDTRVYVIGWGGDATGTGVCSDPVQMDQPKTAMVLWRTQYLVNASSPYGTVTGGGWYDDGNTTFVSLDIGLFQITPEERTRFISWSGDASGNTLDSSPIVVDAPKTALALWDSQFLVTVASPYGTTTGGGWFDDGNTTSVSLDVDLVQISASERVRFLAWSGDASGTSLTSNPILVDSPKTATAVWQAEYLLTIVSNHGTPQGGGWYISNAVAQVYIESVVDTGTGTRFIFTGWTGTVTTTEANTSVIMNSAATVIANWRTEHFVTVLSDHGIAIGDGWYTQGSIANISVQMTVEDESGTWRFVSWSGDYSSTDNATVVVVDAPKTIQANWEMTIFDGDRPVGLDYTWIVIAVVLVIVIVILLAAFLKRSKDKDEEDAPSDVRK